MNDNGLAALAAVLAPLLPQHQEGSGGYPHQSSHRTWTVYDWMAPDALAAAILAALPPDWCGHIGVEEVIAQAQHDAACRDELARQQNREIARLRAALAKLVEAASAPLGMQAGDWARCMAALSEARKVLDGDVR